MLKLKVQNQNVKLKIGDNCKGVDVVVAICRLYMALLGNGISKKDIDWQVNEVLKNMKKLDKERESDK